ncbi:hypothetical protein [Microbacterium marinilacus]|uniref:F5/8 type C domain-containing protein n=1 Tax=Microbacterium marinilacus TaxID=415209 RepID=A0ABP7BP12_9MICO|nr:hypothetical protein [Microbacterium marinilacus]MBY0690056.1 hypothetical protein [Microbacterium marinilacus]
MPAAPAPPPGSRRRAGRARRPAILLGAAVGAAAIVVSVTAVVVGPRDPEPTTVAGPAPVGTDATGVCGFPGERIGAITADRALDTEAVSPDGWDLPAGAPAFGLLATADSLVVVRADERGEMQLVRHDQAGRPLDTISYDLGAEASGAVHDNGSIAIADDGTVFAIDSYDGRRALTAIDAGGERTGSFPVPQSEETTGHPLDLRNVAWVAELDGAPAVLVGEGERTVHAFREDGEYLGVRDELASSQVAAIGASTVVEVTPADSSGAAAIRAVDLTDGSTSLNVPFATQGDGSTPPLSSLRGVAPGPGGEGFLVASEIGIEWVDAVGVRRGFWPTGEAGLSLWEAGALIERDGTYWVLVRDGEVDRVLTLTSEQLTAALSAPVSLTAANEQTLARLGIGIGAGTDAPFDHFDAGVTPAVTLRAESGWGVRDETPDAHLEVRYTVSGDPLLADPVRQPERVAAIPSGGGRTPLELPEPRPGAYEVSLAVVDTRTDDVLSGSCLRYSIGAEGAELDLGGLADGADWGGPAPLRGVQLATALGVDSHRVQLDFGALVPDPTATPSADGIDWSALPGVQLAEAGNGADPMAAAFADLAAAARLAQEDDVDLVVQVGRGGEAELRAVDAGTWEGWVEVLVAEFARRAPGIAHWSPWNEPNLGGADGDGDVAEFVRAVEIPFADAAHRADPAATVLGGNTLGFAFDWWQEAVTTDVCAHIDAVAVHPYTGWNRSWEEEGFSADGAGFDELRAVLGPDCAALPLWDTESGWTSDGGAASWAQGAVVARKLLWYDHDDVAGWTYFFSEGGWGENGLSWSLVQHGSHVKPGALAFATVSRLIDGRDRGELLDVAHPLAHAMRFGGDTDLVAAWSDDARITVTATADAETLETVDVYGARGEVPLREGRAELTLTGSPLFLLAPAGAEISLEPSEPFDDDLLAGRAVTTSSTHVDADPQTITSGDVSPYRPWRSGRLPDGAVDDAPAVEIALSEPAELDRIAVATGSIVCCETGLRDYTLSVLTEDGEWRVVARQEDQFWERVALFEFEPVTATAVRLEVPWTTVRGTRVLDVNDTGFAGGLPPPFRGLQTESDFMVSVAAISAWGPAGR